MIVTFAGDGRICGAVYVAVSVAELEEMIVPIEELPPGTPFTLQVTPRLLVFVTVAVKFCI